MVSEATKWTIWHGVLESSRAWRYYAAVSDKHLKRKRLQNGVEALAGVLALASFLLPWETLVPVAGGFLILVLLLGKYWTNQSDLLSSVADDLGTISEMYNPLFEQANADEIDQSVADKTNEILFRLLQSTCARVNIPVDEKLVQKSQEDAYAVAENWYANASNQS